MFTTDPTRLTAREWHHLTERAASLPYDTRSAEIELDTCTVRLIPLSDAATAGGVMLGKVDRFAILTWPAPKIGHSGPGRFGDWRDGPRFVPIVGTAS